MSRTTSRAVPVLLALALAAPAFAQGGSNNQSQGTATTPESKPRILPGTGGTNTTPATQGETGGGARRNDPAASSTPSETSTGTGTLRGGGDVTTGGSAAKPDKRSDAAPPGALLGARLIPVQAAGAGAPQTTGAASPLSIAPGAEREAAARATPRPAGANRGESRVERQIRDLHAKLRITPAQQPQWDAFAAAMRQNAARMDALRGERAAGLAGMNAVDGMRSYAQTASVHAEDMQRLIPAFEQLYAVMTPEQKTAADRTFREFQKGQRGPARG